MAYLWVAIGGALGSMVRYGFSGVVAQMTGGTFPYGTMFVNVTGALLIGFLASLSAPESRFFIPASARLFLMTGICGGYTTFSTFSLESFNLMRDGEVRPALANMLVSVVLCVLAVWIGYAAALALSRQRSLMNLCKYRRKPACCGSLSARTPASSISPLFEAIVPRPAKPAWPERPCCAARWAMANRAISIPKRFCGSPTIFRS